MRDTTLFEVLNFYRDVLAIKRLAAVISNVQKKQADICAFNDMLVGDYGRDMPTMFHFTEIEEEARAARLFSLFIEAFNPNGIMDKSVGDAHIHE